MRQSELFFGSQTITKLCKFHLVLKKNFCPKKEILSILEGNGPVIMELCFDHNRVLHNVQHKKGKYPVTLYSSNTDLYRPNKGICGDPFKPIIKELEVPRV